jgi:hypothetical protein
MPRPCQREGRNLVCTHGLRACDKHAVFQRCRPLASHRSIWTRRLAYAVADVFLLGRAITCEMFSTPRRRPPTIKTHASRPDNVPPSDSLCCSICPTYLSLIFCRRNTTVSPRSSVDTRIASFHPFQNNLPGKSHGLSRAVKLPAF